MVISDEERQVLEDLLQRAEDTEDDWGISDAVRDYLADPSMSPDAYLILVHNDVAYHLGHVGEGVEDDQSAERARASIHDAEFRLREIRRQRPKRVAEALSRINAHRRQLLMPPLSREGWTDDDILTEDRRLAANPDPPEPPPDADDETFDAWMAAVAARKDAGVGEIQRRIDDALARGDVFSTPNAFPRGGTTVVHRSAKRKRGVALQLTWLDDDGPVGDTEPATTQAAAERVWEDLDAQQRDAFAEAAALADNPRRPANRARAPARAPTSTADYVRVSDIDEAYRRNYIGPGGEIVASSRAVPARMPDIPVGTWMLDDKMAFPWGHEIYELVAFEPRELEPSEFSWDDPKAELTWGGKWRDVQRYVTWLKQGLRPPPITVVQTWGGTLRVTNGHRRLAAADIAGVPVRAWVSWLVEHPDHGSVGLTYELATAGATPGRSRAPLRANPAALRTQVLSW